MQDIQFFSLRSLVRKPKPGLQVLLNQNLWSHQLFFNPCTSIVESLVSVALYIWICTKICSFLWNCAPAKALFAFPAALEMLCLFSRIGGESLAVAQNTYAVSWFKGKELNLVFGLQLSMARIVSLHQCTERGAVLLLLGLLLGVFNPAGAVVGLGDVHRGGSPGAAAMDPSLGAEKGEKGFFLVPVSWESCLVKFSSVYELLHVGLCTSNVSLLDIK